MKKNLNHLFAHCPWGFRDIAEDKRKRREFVDCIASRCAFDTEWVSPYRLDTSFRISRPRKNARILVEVAREMDGWDGSIIEDAAASIGRKKELDDWYERNRIEDDPDCGSWKMTDVYSKWEQSIADECHAMDRGNTEARASRYIPADSSPEAAYDAVFRLDSFTDIELKVNFETVKQVVAKYLDQVAGRN